MRVLGALREGAVLVSFSIIFFAVNSKSLVGPSVLQELRRVRLSYSFLGRKYFFCPVFPYLFCAVSFKSLVGPSVLQELHCVRISLIVLGRKYFVGFFQALDPLIFYILICLMSL